MSKPDNDMDIYDLLNRVDELLDEKAESPEEDFEPEFGDEIDMDATMVFLNAANGYGQDIRNAANGYGREQPQPKPAQDPYGDLTAGPAIKAYNADFRRERGSDRRQSPYEQTSRQNSVPERRPVQQTPVPPAPPVQPAKPAKSGRKKRGCFSRLLSFLLVLALIAAGLHILLRPPMETVLGRKPGTAAILLCGADLSGDRTDTMMLLYIDSLKNEAGLLTLPRDTYTVTDYGASNKLNSAYGRNGGGEEGMSVLLDYVQDIIGYRPDGYMMVQLPMLKDLVDLMGGVEFDVPQDMTFSGKGVGHDITLKAGLQELNGEEAMALLRFRYGYVNQDLGRQDVQKQFLKACIGQWAKASNVAKLPQAMKLFETQGMTNLGVRNYIWIGFNLLKVGFKNISTDTLPGYATYIGDQSYYVLDPGEVADIVQDKYNPYLREITVEDLDIPID